MNFCLIPVGGAQPCLLLLGQRKTIPISVPHRACCGEALSAEAVVCPASRRQEAEQVSSKACLWTVRSESVVNFWDGQRHLLSDAQAWHSLSYVQAWNGDSDGTKEIGRQGRRDGWARWLALKDG